MLKKLIACRAISLTPVRRGYGSL